MADQVAGGNLESRMRELRAEGHSFNAIAARLYAESGVEVTGATVGTWAKKLGIEATS